MIPKKIHYCWFGGAPKPKLAERCIASWKKYCPDYEIIEWNESNFDVTMNDYTRMCIEQKKYAYLSDYVRLYVVEQHGGVYFDTDVEVLCPIDHLLENEAFYCFETPEYVASALVKLGLNRDGMLQRVADALILTPDYMNPFNPATGVTQKTKNTVSIHWYSASCLSPWRRLRTRITRPIRRLFGEDVFKRFRK